MAGEWKKIRIGDHIELATGEAFQSARFRNTPDSGILLARGDNIKEGEFEWGDKARYWPELTPDLERYLLREADILLGMDGSKVGKNWARVRRKDLPCLLVQRVARLRAMPTMDQAFLRFIIGNPMFRDYIERVKTGTSIPHISGGQIKSYEILLPPIAVQKRIAEILGSLDDKIELNRRMNETLEAMARALFQSWFVDFDPVRAKLDGCRPAGMDAETAALFPAAFQDSPLGPIPKGWRVGSIYEISDVIYGAPFASKLFNSNGDGKPLIRIRDLADESPGVWTPEVHLKGYTVQPGDIVVGMDGEFRAYLWGGAEAWLNQRVCVFAPKTGLSAAFVRNSILAPLAQVESTETATTVIHIGKNDIDRFKVIVPDERLQKAFARLAQPWYDRIVANKQQSRTLAALRDTLLPKLLSGELRVSHAEKAAYA